MAQLTGAPGLYPVPEAGTFTPAPDPSQLAPHTPIRSPGSQPHRFTPGAVAMAMMWYVAAAIPAPVQGPRNVVPLTLKYGQQPVPQDGGTTRANAATVAQAYPGAGEPRLLQPDLAMTSRRYIVPLTFRYGQQPQRGPLAAGPAMIIAWRYSWPEEQEPRLPRLTGASMMAPLAMIYRDQPPIEGALTVPDGTLVTWWPPEKEPRLPQYTPASTLVPLTFVYGDQPPRTTGWKLASGELVRLWLEMGEPRLPLPQVGKGYQAPLTLRYGQQPPFLATEAMAGLRWLPALWDAQTEENQAAWNVAPVFVPMVLRALPLVAETWNMPRATTLVILTNQQGPPRLLVAPEYSEWIVRWMPPALGRVASYFSNPPVFVVILPPATGKYGQEHAEASRGIAAVIRFDREHSDAAHDIAAVLDFAREHSGAAHDIAAVLDFAREHGGAALDVSTAVGFSPEHIGASGDVAKAIAFAREHAAALRDLLDAGI